MGSRSRSDGTRVTVRSLAEAEVHIASLSVRLTEVERLTRDHAQRFDTLETHWWKRVWFWLQGWPWYPLNGTRRPW
jgi:hypothetical protein